jgi:hypothetical protein
MKISSWVNIMYYDNLATLVDYLAIFHEYQRYDTFWHKNSFLHTSKSLNVGSCVNVLTQIFLKIIDGMKNISNIII